MPEPMTLGEMLLRAALALLLGGMIGWDRERKEKAAGLRTMMLVSLGSAGVMMGGMELAASLSDASFRIDPTRVMSGVIGGIGFLGAGSIIQGGRRVHGLTTAASIWAAAGVGIAAGAGLYRLAFVLAGAVLVALVLVTALKGTVLPDRHEVHEKRHHHKDDASIDQDLSD
ncbi:MAG: MgtC/SapB family protein [Phycisphaerales bacterium]